MLKIIEGVILNVLRKAVANDHYFRQKIVEIIQAEELPLNKKQLGSVNNTIELLKESITDDLIDITKDMCDTASNQTLIACQAHSEDQIEFINRKAHHLSKSIEQLSTQIIQLSKQLTDHSHKSIVNLERQLTGQLDVIHELADEVAKKQVPTNADVKQTRADVAKIILNVKEQIKDVRIELDAFIDTVSEKIAEIQKKKYR